MATQIMIYFTKLFKTCFVSAAVFLWLTTLTAWWSSCQWSCGFQGSSGDSAQLFVQALFISRLDWLPPGLVHPPLHTSTTSSASTLLSLWRFGHFPLRLDCQSPTPEWPRCPCHTLHISPRGTLSFLCYSPQKRTSASSDISLVLLQQTAIHPHFKVQLLSGFLAHASRIIDGLSEYLCFPL